MLRPGWVLHAISSWPHLLMPGRTAERPSEASFEAPPDVTPKYPTYRPRKRQRLEDAASHENKSWTFPVPISLFLIIMTGPQGSISASPGQCVALSWPGLPLCVNDPSPDTSVHDPKQPFPLAAYTYDQIHICL